MVLTQRTTNALLTKIGLAKQKNRINAPFRANFVYGHIFEDIGEQSAGNEKKSFLQNNVVPKAL